MSTRRYFALQQNVPAGYNGHGIPVPRQAAGVELRGCTLPPWAGILGRRRGRTAVTKVS